MRALGCFLILATLCGCGRDRITLPAAGAQREGLLLATTRPGYSLVGYATGFDGEHDQLMFTFDSPGGFYDVVIRYASPKDRKGYFLNVNGERRMGLLLQSRDEFTDHPAGKVELKRGRNTIAIERGWGFFDIDGIRLIPAGAPRPPRKVPPTLVDGSATPAAKALMERLCGEYGRRTFSGVYSLEEVQYLHELAGVRASILGGDLMDYSPSRVERGATPEGTVEELIRRARQGCIITLSWHWNAPRGLIDRMIRQPDGSELNALWFRGFYAHATTFDVEQALADPMCEDYRLLLRDLDAIAIQLRKFADADIPILWRPLHEADTHAFWWSARGPAAFRALWKLTYERLVDYHGLHNLIWVYTGGSDLQWCPDEKYFDIVGVDAYPPNPDDPLSEVWEALQKRFRGRKLLALTESGHIPDIERSQRFGVYWSYFVPWGERIKSSKLPKEEVIRRFTQAGVLNQPIHGR